MIDFDWNGHTFYSDIDPGFSTLQTYRRVRCVSCNSLIDIGAVCVEYPRVRDPHAVKRASHYHCEECADIWLNLTDIGYCLNPGDDMGEALTDYLTFAKREV